MTSTPPSLPVGRAARARYNAEHSPPLTSATYTGDLLPGRDDDLRWRAEAAARTERRLRAVAHDLVRESLLDGREHASILDDAALGIQVLADLVLGSMGHLVGASACHKT